MSPKWYLTIVLLEWIIPPTHQMLLENCISEKFYRFSKEHIACIPKSPNATDSGVDTATQQELVSVYNEERAKRATSRTQKIVWDDELADLAQKWSDSCAADVTLTLTNSTVPNRFTYSTNTFIDQHSNNFLSIASSAWIFQFNSDNEVRKPANIANVFLDSISTVGCGYAICPDLATKGYFVKHRFCCHYGPVEYPQPEASNDTGAPCSSCNTTCSDSLCDCDGKACRNGGKLNVNTCECTCLNDWNTAGTCEIDCDLVREDEECKKVEDRNQCESSNELYKCPITCGICPEMNKSADHSTLTRVTTAETKILPSNWTNDSYVKGAKSSDNSARNSLAISLDSLQYLLILFSLLLTVTE